MVACSFGTIPNYKHVFMKKISLLPILILLQFQTYSQAGKLDSTFGINGTVLTPFAEGFTYYDAMAIQPDGKIVTAGMRRRTSDYGSEYFSVARYNRDGSLDRVATELPLARAGARGGLAGRGPGRACGDSGLPACHEVCPRRQAVRRREPGSPEAPGAAAVRLGRHQLGYR